MLNEPLIRLIMEQIQATPEHWNQEDWARSSELTKEHICKTTFCFAGWAAFMTDMVDGWGKPTRAGRKAMKSYPPPWESEFPFEEYARDVLGLDHEQADILFGPSADMDPAFDFDDNYQPTAGQRIRRMKEIIFMATGVDIP